MSSNKSVTEKTSPGTSGNPDEALSFPTWNEVLASREDLDSDRKSRWKYALKFCKEKRRPVSITIINA
jgi:hypothetical protein